MPKYKRFFGVKIVLTCLLDLEFNLMKGGYCNACQWSEKKKVINWSDREKYLKNIIKKYKSTNEDFDCIVPVSGGKDGSYVSHTLKNKYNLRPLTVTSRPPLTLSVGDRNLENFVRSGYDHIHITANEKV